MKKKENTPRFIEKGPEEKIENPEELFAKILLLIEEIEEQYKKDACLKIDWIEKYKRLEETVEQPRLFYEIKAIIYEMIEYQSEFGIPDENKNGEIIHWIDIKNKIKEILHSK